MFFDNLVVASFLCSFPNDVSGPLLPGVFLVGVVRRCRVENEVTRGQPDRDICDDRGAQIVTEWFGQGASSIRSGIDLMIRSANGSKPIRARPVGLLDHCEK